jgi:hypothetical protein
MYAPPARRFLAPKCSFSMPGPRASFALAAGIFFSEAMPGHTQSINPPPQPQDARG